MATKKAKKPKTKKPTKRTTGGQGNKGLLYGVLKGTAVGGERETDGKTPHYQIKIRAPHDGKEITWRCPVNVRSSDGSEVLFFVDSNLFSQAPDKSDLTAIWKKKLKALEKLTAGFTALPKHEPGVALDLVREAYVDPKEMTRLPSTGPEANDDIQDEVEMLISRAKEQSATVYVFGEMFKSGRSAGVHDIHMNQGNRGKFKKDNGIYQDGGLVIQFASGRHVAMLFAFQTQTWDTDDHGNPK